MSRECRNCVLGDSKGLKFMPAGWLSTEISPSCYAALYSPEARIHGCVLKLILWGGRGKGSSRRWDLLLLGKRCCKLQPVCRWNCAGNLVHSWCFSGRYYGDVSTKFLVKHECFYSLISTLTVLLHSLGNFGGKIPMGISSIMSPERPVCNAFCYSPTFTVHRV